MIFCRTARHGEAPYKFADGGKGREMSLKVRDVNLHVRKKPTGVGGTNLHRVLYLIVAKYFNAILLKFYFAIHI